MDKLFLFLLGEFEIFQDDIKINESFRTDKERALLAFLITEGSQPLRREALAELLWPDKEEGKARTSLRQALYGIRTAISDQQAVDPLLQLSDDLISINPKRLPWTDTETFNTHFQTTKTHHHDLLETCPGCNQHLQLAVERYRGDFMTGFYIPNCPQFQEWISFQREKFFQTYLVSLQQLIRFFSHTRDFDSAHQFAWKQVQAAPLEERGYRQLMRMLASAGRRSAALEQYDTCRNTLKSELGVAPSAETQTLYEQIRSGAYKTTRMPVSLPTAPTSHSNLPVPLTSFVGREQEIEHLEKCLQNPNCRLITLVGIAGCGKTRLGIRVASVMRNEFPNGTWFISLSKSNSNISLVEIILHQLGLVKSQNLSPKKQLINYLKPLKTLLFLDNFEEKHEETGLLIDILQEATEIKILVTSRVRLNYQAACLFDIVGLVYPDLESKYVLDYPAVELFLSRAQHRMGRPLRTDQNLAHIVKICYLLKGHPLGIELAAATSREISTKMIAERLFKNIEILETREIDVPERHKSLRASLSLTWNNLSDREKSAFLKLAVFPENFTRDAALEITRISGAILVSLLDKSLLYRLSDHRFAMHPVVKAFAQFQRNQAKVDLLETEWIYASYYLSLLCSHADELRKGRMVRQSLRDLSKDRNNLYQAWETAINERFTAKLMEVLDSFFNYSDFNSQLNIAREQFLLLSEGYQDQNDEQEKILYGRSLGYLAWFEGRLGQFQGSIQNFQRSVDALESLSANKYLSFVYFGMGFMMKRASPTATALEWFKKSLATASECGDRYDEILPKLMITEIKIAEDKLDNPFDALIGLLNQSKNLGHLRATARILLTIGDWLCSQGNCQHALLFFEQAYGLSQELDVDWSSATAMYKIARVKTSLGAETTGLQMYEQCLSIFRQVGDLWRVGATLLELGALSQKMGNQIQAGKYYQEALKYATELNIDSLLKDVTNYIGDLYINTGRVDDAYLVFSWMSKRLEQDEVLGAEIEEKLDQIRSEWHDLDPLATRYAGETASIYDITEQLNRWIREEEISLQPSP